MIIEDRDDPRHLAYWKVRRVTSLKQGRIIPGVYTLVPCEHCGTMFWARARGREQKYCSGDCGLKRYKARKLHVALRAALCANLEFHRSLDSVLSQKGS